MINYSSTIKLFVYEANMYKNIISIFTELNSKLDTRLGTYRIDNLTSFNLINNIGLWGIGSIDPNYAQLIGLNNNPGDYKALVISCNYSNGIFQYGNILLFSPRWDKCNFCHIRLWAGVYLTEQNIKFRKLLNILIYNIFLNYA